MLIRSIHWACVILGVVAFYTWLQFAFPGLIGIDGYFHIRYSRELWMHGLVKNFQWLVYTIYSRRFADDHLLFHIVQIPFTFGNLITGAKIYGIVFPTAVFALFFGILIQQNIRFPFLWTALLFVASAPFLMRIGMARATSLSLIFLLAGAWCILSGHIRRLLPLAFAYVWLYGGFPLLFVMASLAWVARWIANRQKSPQILVFCGLGIALGLIFNPYFPYNISFLIKSYTHIELGMFPPLIPGGNEDYPYAASSAVRNALPVWMAVFAGIFTYLISKKHLNAQSLFLFLFSIALLCLYLNVRRFIEYWAPFGVLFAAFALNPFLPSAPLKNLWRKTTGKIGLCAICLALVLAGWDTLTHVADYRIHSRSPQAYAGAAEYLRNNTPANAIVFTADWDDFPLLFHYNTHNRYIVGMDLRYLYYYSPELCDTWIAITRGKTPDALNAIKEKFKADYVFSLKKDKDFLKNFTRSPGTKQVVYEDADAIVYKI